MSKIVWYTLDSEQKPDFHEPVDLPVALKLFDQIIAKYKLNYVSIESPVTDSMIGFMKSDKYFMEIYIKGFNDFIVICQLPNVESESVNGNKFAYQDKLSSNFEMQKRIRQFFTLSHQELKRRLK
ncbi:MAG: hypothetical protein IH612_15575 [Desulfofustis sp.]|nr:hypothetical protein [Desulfofustis sp.]